MTNSRYLASLRAFLLAFLATAQAHLNILYPVPRGYNLATNGTVADTDGLSIGVAPGSNKTVYPYGMQWQYPCGGLPVADNRSTWPTTGGVLSFQPGLQAGHSKGLLYVNLGLGTLPKNYSLPMVPMFAIDGPSNDEYQDGICFPQVPLPAGVTVKPGDNATIQIVEAAKHGAALYSCVDITFVLPSDVPPLSDIACATSSSITISAVTSGNPKSGWYSPGQAVGVGVGVGAPLLITVAALSFFLWKARRQQQLLLLQRKT